MLADIQLLKNQEGEIFINYKNIGDTYFKLFKIVKIEDIKGV